MSNKHGDKVRKSSRGLEAQPIECYSFIDRDGIHFEQGSVAPPLCTFSTLRSSRLALLEMARRRGRETCAEVP